MRPRARAVDAERWADPPEKRALSVGGEEPKGFTAVTAGTHWLLAEHQQCLKSLVA